MNTYQSREVEKKNLLDYGFTQPIDYSQAFKEELMRNNIQSKIDAGYTYDELLSEGLASFDDIARYESQYSLYDEDGEPKRKRVKVKPQVKPKIQTIKPKKEPEIDFDF